MNRSHRLIAPRPGATEAWHHALASVLIGLLVAGLLGACASDSLRAGAANADLSSVATYCFQSVSVRTGKHEIAAFSDASIRAMKRTLSERGHTVSCEETSRALNLDYDMTFDAQSLSWQASMRVLAGQGNVLYQAYANDAIEQGGAFQYTTESTAQKLLGSILDN